MDVPDPTLVRSQVSANDKPSVSDDDYEQFVQHVNALGLELAGKMVEDNELEEQNVVFSPLSAMYVLGMVYAGARGETAEELRDVLSDGLADDVFHASANRLARELRSRRLGSSSDRRRVELDLVGGIFLDKSLAPNEVFLDLLSRDYNSGVHLEDFRGSPGASRENIESWISRQTRGKLSDVLSNDSVTSLTRLVLVNTLSFYGSWQHPFPVRATEDRAFHLLSGDEVQTPTMSLGSEFLPLDIQETYTIVELPYVGERVRMTIVLPAEGELENVRKQVSAEWLSAALPTRDGNVHVRLPRFELRGDTVKLSDGLQSLGLRAVFSPDADLSGMGELAADDTSALVLKEVLQKAYIRVDETGAEAHAASGAQIGLLSSPTPLDIDRPFLFFIRDDSGAVLFSGQVVDPR